MSTKQEAASSEVSKASSESGGGFEGAGAVTPSSSTNIAEEKKLNEENDDSAPMPSFITQTNASGQQLAVATEEDVQEDDVPPPIPEDQPAPQSLCSTFVRYLCCLDFEETYYSHHHDAPLLLEDQESAHFGKPLLVLDLDETLVHSSFEEVPEADFKLDIELDTRVFPIFVIMRPGVEEFLSELSDHYEIVVFTASVGEYARKVIGQIDPTGKIVTQLYREHCTYHEGNFVKDLKRLNRPIEKVIIVDNSPACYQWQPENAIGCSTFMNDKSDRELFYCKDFLLKIKNTRDVRKELKKYRTFISQSHQQHLDQIAEDADKGVASEN